MVFFPEVGGRIVAGDDVVGEDVGERILHLRLQEIVHRARWKRLEGGVDRGENCEGARAGKRFDEPGSLHRRHQRGVILRIDGILDDVLRGIHRRAADLHGLFGRHLGHRKGSARDGQRNTRR